MGLGGRLKSWLAQTLLMRALKKGWGQVAPADRENIMEWLKGKRTIISAILLGLAVMAQHLGWVEVSEQVNDLGEVVQNGAWLIAVQKTLAVLIGIFMRLGIGKKEG